MSKTVEDDDDFLEGQVTEDDVINMHTEFRINGKIVPMKEANPQMYNATLKIMSYWGTHCILDHVKGMQEDDKSINVAVLELIQFVKDRKKESMGGFETAKEEVTKQMFCSENMAYGIVLNRLEEILTTPPKEDTEKEQEALFNEIGAKALGAPNFYFYDKPMNELKQSFIISKREV